MKKYLCSVVLLVVMIVITGFVGYVEAKDTVKSELNPMMRVRPAELSFNCNIVERGKEFAATNASKRTMTMNAKSSESWVTVEPSTQPDVQPMGTATFMVSVNCRELKGAKLWTGSVTIEGMGSISKILVKAKPKLEPAARPVK